MLHWQMLKWLTSSHTQENSGKAEQSFLSKVHIQQETRALQAITAVGSWCGLVCQEYQLAVVDTEETVHHLNMAKVWSQSRVPLYNQHLKQITAKWVAKLLQNWLQAVLTTKIGMNTSVWQKKFGTKICNLQSENKICWVKLNLRISLHYHLALVDFKPLTHFTISYA